MPLEEAQAALKAVGAPCVRLNKLIRAWSDVLHVLMMATTVVCSSADGAEALSFEHFARWWHGAKASPAPADAAQRVAEPPGSAA